MALSIVCACSSSDASGEGRDTKAAGMGALRATPPYASTTCTARRYVPWSSRMLKRARYEGGAHCTSASLHGASTKPNLYCSGRRSAHHAWHVTTTSSVKAVAASRESQQLPPEGGSGTRNSSSLRPVIPPARASSVMRYSMPGRKSGLAGFRARTSCHASHLVRASPASRACAWLDSRRGPTMLHV
eukprot:2460679-Rhodomonas_salina.2